MGRHPSTSLPFSRRTYSPSQPASMALCPGGGRGAPGRRIQRRRHRLRSRPTRSGRGLSRLSGGEEQRNRRRACFSSDCGSSSPAVWPTGQRGGRQQFFAFCCASSRLLCRACAVPVVWDGVRGEFVGQAYLVGRGREKGQFQEAGTKKTHASCFAYGCVSWRKSRPRTHRRHCFTYIKAPSRQNRPRQSCAREGSRQLIRS